MPDLATVSSGSQVTWINADTVVHTATSGTPTGGPSGHSIQAPYGQENPNQSWFKAKGEQSLIYYRIIHPWLTGELQMTL